MRSYLNLSLLFLAGSIFLAASPSPAAEASTEVLVRSLERKANMLSQSKQAAKHVKRVELLKTLAEHLAKIGKKEVGVNAPVSAGNSALMLAVALGEKQIVRSLLHMGADPRQTNKLGKSAPELAKDDTMRRILSENTPITTWDEATRLFESLVVEEGSAGGFRGENGELYNKRVDIISSWNKVAKEQAAYNIGDMLQTVSGGRGAARLVAFLASRPNVVASPFCCIDVLRAWEQGRISEDERDCHLAALAPYADINSALRLAAQCGNLPQVRYLLSQGAAPMESLPYRPPCTNDEAFVNGIREAYGLPIGIAAASGCADTVTYLLSQGDYTPVLDKLLACSCLSPHAWSAKVEKLLLEKGAKHTQLSLTAAIMGGRVELVQQALQVVGADKAALTRDLVTLVGMGCDADFWASNNRRELSALLVKQGADIHALETIPQGEKKLALLELLYPNARRVWRRVGLDWYEALVELGLDEKKVHSVPVRTDSDDKALLLNHAACYADDGHAAAYFLERGISPSARADGGKSALDDSCKAGDGKRWMLAVAACKEEQADAQEKAHALGYALATGSVKLAEKMVRNGAEVEAALKARYSAGCYYYGVNGAMRGFNWLGSGESDYTRDKKYAASYYSDHPLFQLLYDMKEERCHETLKWLLSKKPDMANILNEPIDELGATLLIVMARDGYKGLPAVPTIPPAPVEAVAWLLKHGADPNVQDMDGKTALDYATDKKKALLRAAVKKAGK